MRINVFENMEEKLDMIRTDGFYAPYIKQLEDYSERECEKDAPDLDFTNFNYFFTTGSRAEYESRYYLRRNRFACSMLLYLIYGEQKYLDEMSNMVWLICGEITWVLPAHLKSIGPSEYRTHIDLFAAETAVMLAEALSLVGDKLPEKVRDMIINEIETRIFTPYETKTYWWETLHSNWAAVCGGSVGMAYMYLAPERFVKVKDRLLKTILSFLEGYGDDGCCTEGISYWGYGFSFFVFFADMLLKFTDGKVDLIHTPKVCEIAKYLNRVILRRNLTVSFSDGSERIDVSAFAGLISYLVKNCGAAAPPSESVSFSSGDREIKLVYWLRNLLWSDPDYFKVDAPAKEETIYFRDAQWYIGKRKLYSFAAKAGHNDEEHNHNDVGSFIFADDSGQLLADLGAMEYTKDNFDPAKRYTLLQNSSLGHSVPIVDGREQCFGRQYSADNVKVEDNEFSMEIQGAYGVDDPKIRRSFKLSKRGVTLCDEFENTDGHTITERFVSIVEPKPESDGLHIGAALIWSESKPEIQKRVLKDHHLKDKSVWLIDYPADDKSFKLSVFV